MKYMGSKQAMLQNGLGELLRKNVARTSCFVDLFSGSGAVATFVARNFSVPVLAVDLQRYSSILAGAIIHRTVRFNWELIWKNWYSRAESQFKVRNIPTPREITRSIVSDLRAWCNQETGLPITSAYGGHYFSPQQAVWIDALRASIPKREPAKTVALAALIQSASQCAAAPGHTAQPFQPTPSAMPFLEEAWSKDIISKTKTAFESLANQFAQRSGKAIVGDANFIASCLKEGDLAFIDPPYSAVHYSRFYHVLETIANGDCGEVTGVGRYPASEKRPHSKYSILTESSETLDDLLETLSSSGARAILTFPDHNCSNGLDGDSVREIAEEYFRVQEMQVESKFSSLGGVGDERDDEAGRAARKKAKELVLFLRPK